MSTTRKPYVSRSEAKDFLAAFANALKNPAESQMVFHIWGIGGVGKTTLTHKLREAHKNNAAIAQVIFGRTENIEGPIPLMAKLYEQIAPYDSWNRDPFWERYNLYSDTILTLETQPPSRLGAVDDDQIKHVKTLLRLGVDVFGQVFLSERQEKFAKQVVERSPEAFIAGRSLKNDVVGFLQQHRATKQNTALQNLMLKPLTELTQAFADGLKQQAQQQPVVLVLDAYEKVPTVLDAWLCRTLLGNTCLMSHPVRLVIAGRQNIRRGEGWRTLHQDTNCLYERTFNRFTREQTRDYLTRIGVKDESQIRDIYQVTKGLPYYLNWVREQREKGLTLTFAEGNQRIVQLLLGGLTAPQKQVVQLAACCRRFDLSLIRHLTEQHGLDFATAVDDTLNCFDWLVQQSFVEPVGRRWRVDDVARDIFRKDLLQDDREQFERINGQLADDFQRRADQEVSPEAAPIDKYENPDWREPDAEFLYYLLFTRRPNVQTQFISHLLEARFFWQDELVQTPIQAIDSEGALEDDPACLDDETRQLLTRQLLDNPAYLNYTTRQFLKDILPVALLGWAVLEEIPIDYPYKQGKYSISKAAADAAVQRCLACPDEFEGLAKFMALLYKAKRCPEAQQQNWLCKAQTQAKTLSAINSPDFLVDLYLWKLGDSFYNSNFYQEAIDCYDAALAIKPDIHEALYNKGNALDDLGRYEEAIDCYDAALDVKPDYHEALYNKACCYGVQGDASKALKFLQEAISLDAEYRSMAQTDAVFDAIRHDPRFQALTTVE